MVIGAGSASGLAAGGSGTRDRPRFHGLRASLRSVSRGADAARLFHSGRDHGNAALRWKREVSSQPGSIPCDFMTWIVVVPVRNLINSRAASGALELALTPAVN